MKNVYGPRVLVTGATSGIGRACAEAFAREGCAVTGVSRHARERTLTLKNGGSLTLRKMDVTSGESVRKALCGAEYDIAVLCAGMGVSGPAEELPIEYAEKQMEVNYFGVLRTAQAVLPAMRRQGHGLLIVIGSIAGRVPIPMQSHYSSSKYALEAFTEAVRMEMRDFGVRAVILEPGDTKTGFTAAREKMVFSEDSVYRKIAEQSVAKMEKDERGGRPPSSVAKEALRMAGLKDPPARVPVGIEYKALMQVLRILPDGGKEAILRLMYLPKEG